MSGHSKWSTIKRDKGLNDSKRGQAFTKAANVITVAAREGGSNPDMNFKLRLAIDAARAINMPKDNIERAISRGAGGVGGEILENMVYEGFGPAGIALLIEAVTDNKQRTASNVRSTLDKNGGNLGGPGSVAWMFTTTALTEVKIDNFNPEEVALTASDYGAVDFETVEDSLLLYSASEDLQTLKDFLTSSGYVIVRSELSKEPTTTVKINSQEDARKIFNLIEKLEELDDVQKVYANFDIEDSVLESVSTQSL